MTKQIKLHDRYKVTDNSLWANKGEIVTLVQINPSGYHKYTVPSCGGKATWLAPYLVTPYKETSHVDDVYDSLSDGQRAHMLNKLGKHGYDARTSETIKRHKEAYKERTAPPKVPSYRVGDRVDVYGDEHILAQVGYSMCVLINIRNGYRYTEPVKVHCAQKITQDELDRMQ